MNDREDIDGVSSQIVDDDKWGGGNYQLTGSVNTPRSPHLRKVRELFHLFANPGHLFCRSLFTVFQDKVVEILDVFQGGDQPANLQLACLPLCLLRHVSHHFHCRFMIKRWSARVERFYTLLDQIAMVLLQRKVLIHCFIDYERPVTLVDGRSLIESRNLLFGRAKGDSLQGHALAYRRIHENTREYSVFSTLKPVRPTEACFHAEGTSARTAGPQTRLP
jgi:hypothetical protein